MGKYVIEIFYKILKIKNSRWFERFLVILIILLFRGFCMISKIFEKTEF